MKRVVSLLLSALFLTGCLGSEEELDRMMTFRAKLLAGMGCSFDCVITADYQDQLYTFNLTCRSDENGTVTFTVTQPESIAGISGTIGAEGGELTFDDQALAFETLADGQLTPVSAPWLLVKTLRGGYVRACTTEDEQLRISINDSYEEDALEAQVWFSSDDVPEYGEFLWQNRRILSLEVINFEIL